MRDLDIYALAFYTFLFKYREIYDILPFICSVMFMQFFLLGHFC